LFVIAGLIGPLKIPALPLADQVLFELRPLGRRFPLCLAADNSVLNKSKPRRTVEKTLYILVPQVRIFLYDLLAQQSEPLAK
jgi:hypothetical protein